LNTKYHSTLHQTVQPPLRDPSASDLLYYLYRGHISHYFRRQKLSACTQTNYNLFSNDIERGSYLFIRKEPVLSPTQSRCRIREREDERLHDSIHCPPNHPSKSLESTQTKILSLGYVTRTQTPKLCLSTFPLCRPNLCLDRIFGAFLAFLSQTEDFVPQKTLTSPTTHFLKPP
jgi:hypothetical protein